MFLAKLSRNDRCSKKFLRLSQTIKIGREKRRMKKRKRRKESFSAQIIYFFEKYLYLFLFFISTIYCIGLHFKFNGDVMFSEDYSRSSTNSSSNLLIVVFAIEFRWKKSSPRFVFFLLVFLSSDILDCIRRKDNLDHLNHGGWTPLMYAAYVGRDNILNLLLEAGAKIDIQSKLGLTALMLASYCASESIMYFLLQVCSSSVLLLNNDHRLIVWKKEINCVIKDVSILVNKLISLWLLANSIINWIKYWICGACYVVIQRRISGFLNALINWSPIFFSTERP